MLEILNLTENFFIQQAELYGKSFYFEDDFNTRLLSEIPEAQTLTEFNLQIKDCTKCKLWEKRTKFVFGTGNSEANLMCIGEAPGYDEDKAGEPFVGAAGQLLNRILNAIGFQRQEVYITNIVKCRPPGNRNPEPDEIAQCLPYLQQQLAMIQPKLILALGKVAAHNLLGMEASIESLRGKVHQIDDIKVIVTYHPAALLRKPQWKRGAWEDVQKLRKIYDEIVGDKPPFEFNKNKSS
jgi:DNA polymerase